MKKTVLSCLTIFFLSTCLSWTQTLYFPPISSTATWETTDPASLNWCPDRINNLYSFLEQENTKGFIVLKDGKIVLERYFGTFTNQSLWYWASAGKTLTAFLVGKAQEEGFLSINDRTSLYLGAGWTSCTPEQENNITIRNQLTMTSGLDDGVADSHCTLSSCLNYLAAPGTRWAYHNAPYTLLESVLENATGQSVNNYTQQKLKNLTGMNGLWAMSDFDNVYYSNARSMARFGLLIQGNGAWNGSQLINSSYFNQMISTSQDLNKSYGYLWWLNGKPSFMVPTSQLVFPGSYAPDAPADMIAGIGKNSQFVCISPSRGLVVIRMGDVPSSSDSEVPFVFLNQIWEKINTLDCGLATQESTTDAIAIGPNPADSEIKLNIPKGINFKVEITTITGQIILSAANENQIDVSTLSSGLYLVRVQTDQKTTVIKLHKK